ncbi:MAG: tetratricopeptide repeat protein [Saprospirales bacterium]|nr:tetratricopeptide repeat protein [Saprospirales bacterium]
MQNKLQHIKEFIKKHKTLFIVLTVLKLLLKIGIVLYFVCKVNDVAAQSTNKILRQGNKEYKNQKYNNATESYSKALQKEPKDVRAHFNQGDALFQLNELDKAKESYTNAAKLSTNTDIQAKCFYNIGNAYYKQEKWEESAKAYKTSLKLNPKDADAKYNLMMALSKIKKKREKKERRRKKKRKRQQKRSTEKDQQKGYKMNKTNKDKIKKTNKVKDNNQKSNLDK